MKEEWCPSHIIGCECSVNNVSYDATDLIIEVEPFNDKGVLKLIFRNIFSYRITLEHFRWCDDSIDTRKHTIYEVHNSRYIEWLNNAGLRELYDKAQVHHYAIKTTEHIIDVLTPETMEIIQ